MGNSKFSEADKDLLEEAFMSGKLSASCAVAQLKGSEIGSWLSANFAPATLKRHMDDAKQKVMIKAGSQREQNF